MKSVYKEATINEAEKLLAAFLEGMPEVTVEPGYLEKHGLDPSDPHEYIRSSFANFLEQVPTTVEEAADGSWPTPRLMPEYEHFLRYAMSNNWSVSVNESTLPDSLQGESKLNILLNVVRNDVAEKRVSAIQAKMPNGFELALLADFSDHDNPQYGLSDSDLMIEWHRCFLRYANAVIADSSDDFMRVLAYDLITNGKDAPTAAVIAAKSEALLEQVVDWSLSLSTEEYAKEFNTNLERILTDMSFDENVINEYLDRASSQSRMR